MWCLDYCLSFLSISVHGLLFVLLSVAVFFNFIVLSLSECFLRTRWPKTRTLEYSSQVCKNL